MYLRQPREPFHVPLIALEPQSRGWLHERIAARFDAMLAAPAQEGFAVDMGYNPTVTNAKVPDDVQKRIGFTDEDLKKPIIGIANSYNELIPGHIHLDKITQAAKAGVRLNGGTPLEFGVIGVCDGLAMHHAGMKYSLPSRELIADSIEIMATAHPVDGLILVANCDKIVPGMLMAALRLNIPAILISGGPMLAGRFKGQAVDLITVFEGVGAVKGGKISEDELKEISECACPGCGSCAGMFTANTMNCLTEALGLSLPGNGTVLATHADRRRLFAYLDLWRPARIVPDSTGLGVGLLRRFAPIAAIAHLPGRGKSNCAALPGRR